MRVRLLGLLKPLGRLGILGLVGTLMGCSGDSATDTFEPTPQPSEMLTPISFSGGLQEEQTVTRATPLEENTNFFKVYGFKNLACDDKGNEDMNDDVYSSPQQVFPGYVVKWVENSDNTTTTNSSGWEYVNQQPLGQEEQTVKYWDWSAAAYRFFAVAGASGTNVVTGEYKTHNAGMDSEYEAYEVSYVADASNEATIPYFSHLWFSTGKLPLYNERQFGQPVRLEFLKPFSKVLFYFIFEDPTKATQTTLTDKEFCPVSGNTIKTRGKVTVSYPLTGTATAESFSVDAEGEEIKLTQDYYTSVERRDPSDPTSPVIDPYYNADATVLNKIYTVLPATGQGNYTMTVSVNGEPKTTTVPAQFMDWLPGYQYTYIFKVHVDDAVTIDNVQSAFTPWTDHEADHTVYNW